MTGAGFSCCGGGTTHLLFGRQLSVSDIWIPARTHPECPPRDFCKSLLFSTAELSQGQQRFHECLRVAAGYIERWHSASWPALLVQLGTEVACNDLAPSLPSMKTDTLGKQDRCCGCWSPPDPTAAGASGGCTACEELLDAVAVSDADSCKHMVGFSRTHVSWPY